MTSSPEHRVLQVPLGNRSYQIHVGVGLLDDSTLIGELIEGRRLLVVSDENVAPLYLERAIDGLLSRAAGARRLILPPGEAFKNASCWQQILDDLIDDGALRDSLLVALGGGVIGDLTGFAAACYMRGIDFIQCPTTLLAQVDASVGGKTAINHARGKNLIGAFHQPCAVVIDVATLATLPAREYAAGLAETVKYGAVVDRDFFDWLEQHADALAARHPEVLIEAVENACRAKADIVAADEREQGVRALLNFGHTFGHAIETATDYQRYLHGEAVAIGMVLAARLSAELGHCEIDDAVRLAQLLARLDLPTRLPEDLDAARLWRLMQLDKKNRRGQVRLVLTRGLGSGFCTADTDPTVVRELLAAAAGEAVVP